MSSYDESIYTEVKQWLSENSEEKSLPENIKQNLLRFEALTEREKEALQVALLAIPELPAVIQKFMPDRLRELGDPLSEVSKHLTLQAKQNLAATGKSMHAVFHESNLHSKFSECVAFGQQNKAEKLLRDVFQGKPEKIQATLLDQSTFTDYSGRTFKCSAYEYAYWAKDTHMCRMLEPYMDEDSKAKMLARINANDAAGLSYQQNGVEHRSAHFDLTVLRMALQAYVDAYDERDADDKVAAMGVAWRNVGLAQRDVPAHVAQEYCRPDRSFFPRPPFNEPALPRILNLYHWAAERDESWFPLTSSTSGPGFDFAVVRGIRVGLSGRDGFGVDARGMGDSTRDDLAAVCRLDEVRTRDLTQSRENLTPPALSQSMSV